MPSPEVDVSIVDVIDFPFSSLAPDGIAQTLAIVSQGEPIPLHKDNETRSSAHEFLSRIGRPDVEDRLSPQTPWAYVSMEIYRPDLKGQGGLGMLASDTLEVGRTTGTPMAFITPFYREESSQALDREFDEAGNVVGFRHRNVLTPADPEERGFEKAGTVQIHTGAHELPQLDVRVKQDGSVNIVTLDEPHFRELYADGPSGNHRLYQEAALGFGGHQALKMLGIEPSVSQQLNEAPTVFAALARFDDKLTAEQSKVAQEVGINDSVELSEDQRVAIFEDVLQGIRDTTIYTNHTLIQAVEGKFSKDQFDYFVMPNIQNPALRLWLEDFMDQMIEQDGGIRLSTIAIELAGKKNGVSLIHAQEASKMFQDRHGNPVEFTGITNGIAVDRWGDPALLDLYRQEGVMDEFGLPVEGYQDAIDALDPAELLLIKEEARHAARENLQQRQNQYGEPIMIKDDETMLVWKRRWAMYKRPEMLFSDPEQLADILEQSNATLVLAGRPHSEDGPALESLNRTLMTVHNNDRLRDRVHYLVDYDESAGRDLVHAADISINTPTIWRPTGEDTYDRVSTEACATSFMKDVLANTILVSTEDGGVADPRIIAEQAGQDYSPSYIEITGPSYEQEVASLYGGVRQAITEVQDSSAWVDRVKAQAKDFLPVVSGARMEADYIDLSFPREIADLALAAA